MKTTALIVSMFLLLSGCSKSNTEESSPRNQNTGGGTSEPIAPQEAPPRKEFSTLAEAIDGIKPLMSDTQDAISPGTVMLAFWAADRLKWQELQGIPITKYALIMKDSDEQRGKSICASGRIIEIASEKVEGRKFYSGGIYDDAGRIYRFVAVKSTGELVAQSFATICGIVTGRQSYQNSVGGVAHAISLVGMFDLPENRK